MSINFEQIQMPLLTCDVCTFFPIEGGLNKETLTTNKIIISSKPSAPLDHLFITKLCAVLELISYCMIPL